MTTGQRWTDERVEQLKTLWADGRACSQIARILGDGISRNAVIGKVNRLGLAARGPRGGSAGQARTYPMRRKAKITYTPPVPVIEPAPVILESGAIITLESVTSGQCRWPLWRDDAGAPFRVCGSPCPQTKPYCTFHERKAWVAPKPHRARDKSETEIAWLHRATGALRAFGT